MKKKISIVLAALVVLSVFAFSGCGKKEDLKFGLGVISTYGKTINADGETKGSASVTNTAAAVLLDKNGKIVKCDIDTVDGKIEYTSKGELVTVNEYKTKGELKEDYGMSAIGKTEWYKQVDALCKVAVGKDMQQVKALLAEDGKGNDEVIKAGCTIFVTDFVKALEKAITNAEETTASADDNLSLGFVTKQEKGLNATADKEGSCEVNSSISAAVVANGKVVAMKSDVATAKFTFTTLGESKTDVSKALPTKRELGKDYNMAAYGQDLNGDGVVKEWFEQADAFDAACKGKTSDEISALVVEGYGVDSLKSAGCTIAVSDMAEAAIKAVK